MMFPHGLECRLLSDGLCPREAWKVPPPKRFRCLARHPGVFRDGPLEPAAEAVDDGYRYRHRWAMTARTVLGDQTNLHLWRRRRHRRRLRRPLRRLNMQPDGCGKPSMRPDGGTSDVTVSVYCATHRAYPWLLPSSRDRTSTFFTTLISIPSLSR